MITPQNRALPCLAFCVFCRQIRNLNFYLADEERIRYSRIDMAKVKKSRGKGVMDDLGVIAEASLAMTGVFCNFVPDLEPLRADSVYKDLARAVGRRASEHSAAFGKVLQTGVARTNCVDCLDRTNTAQFVIGKCALAVQLYCLSLIPEPWLTPQSDCTRMLEKMYEDLGNSVSQQYGGSKVVHTIKSYKDSKGALSHKANDLTQNFRRYYSNTLSDAEKQNVINLFLGVFR